MNRHLMCDLRPGMIVTKKKITFSASLEVVKVPVEVWESKNKNTVRRSSAL